MLNVDFSLWIYVSRVTLCLSGHYLPGMLLPVLCKHLPWLCGAEWKEGDEQTEARAQVGAAGTFTELLLPQPSHHTLPLLKAGSEAVLPPFSQPPSQCCRGLCSALEGWVCSKSSYQRACILLLPLVPEGGIPALLSQPPLAV